MKSNESDPARLANAFCFALYSSAHAMMKTYTPLLKDLGLTYSQFLVLFALWEKDAQTVSELGNALFLDSGTLTPLLKRMEKDGRVQRARDTVDERQVKVTLTPRGRALKSKGVSIARAFHAATGKSQREIGAMQKDLTTVRDKLLQRLK